MRVDLSLDKAREIYERTDPYPQKPSRVWVSVLRGKATKLGKQWIEDCKKWQIRFLEWYTELIVKTGKETMIDLLNEEIDSAFLATLILAQAGIGPNHPEKSELDDQYEITEFKIDVNEFIITNRGKQYRLGTKIEERSKNVLLMKKVIM